MTITQNFFMQVVYLHFKKVFFWGFVLSFGLKHFLLSPHFVCVFVYMYQVNQQFLLVLRDWSCIGDDPWAPEALSLLGTKMRVRCSKAVPSVGCVHRLCWGCGCGADGLGAVCLHSQLWHGCCVGWERFGALACFSFSVTGLQVGESTGCSPDLVTAWLL